MGDTLFGKPYGLTHEEMLKAYHILTATAKKTPYQLDLEVKDRKPSIVPKVGDKVKIKSREWYEKWKDPEKDVSFPGVGCCFVPGMADLCGRIFTVGSVIDFIDGNRYCLGFRNYHFVSEMFEEVYPKELSTGDGLTKASDAIGTFISGLEKGSSDASAIPAINPVQGIGIPTDWSKIISDTSAIITLPDNRGRLAFTQAETELLRNRWLPKEEPELQTIKRHRFVKLEKL